MLTAEEIFYLVGAAGLGLLLLLVTRWRRSTHATHVRELAAEVVCDHLRPALTHLLDHGYEVRWVGQYHDRDAPVEIHVYPGFDPQTLYDQLQLADPAFVSERNVLYCKEDWCEIRTAR
jgi:hypothetical protein